MSTLTAYGPAALPNTTRLSAAQTGNGASTNVLDRGGLTGPALVEITTTVGATPTVTVDLQGSTDNVNWFNVDYATVAAPETPAVASLVIISATVTRAILRPNQPWRYFRLNYTLNTNVTSTVDVTTFQGN